MRITKSIFLATLTASSLLVHTGCFTLVGVVVGSGLDAKAPDTLIYAAGNLKSVGSNLSGQIQTTRGERRMVTIVRTEFEPEEAYRTRVAAVCSLSSPAIPVPPDTVNVVIGQTLYRGGVLTGYGSDGIWFAPAPGRQLFHLSWDRISVIRSSTGSIWTGEELRSACDTAGVPARLGLLVRPAKTSLRSLVDDGHERTEFVPAGNLRSVVVAHQTYNIWWCLVAGLAVDLAVSSILLRDVNLGWQEFGSKAH